MPATKAAARQRLFLPRSELGSLIQTLQGQGYTVLAPSLSEGVISLRPIRSEKDLPAGLRAEQSPGRYRVTEGDPEVCFQSTLGPDGPKRYFFPPVQMMFRLHVEGCRFAVDEGPPEPPKLAFLGVRSCELAAMAIQDRVFGARDPRTFRCESNPYYAQVRESALIIAVNCTRPSDNCFCGSMGTGPVAEAGFDLAMTELRAGFVIEVGTDRGEELLGRLAVREASATEIELAELRLAQARTSMGRQLDTDGLADFLEIAVEHPHWGEVAKRCLGCGNCTMVCPTCSCSSMVDGSDLASKSVSRSRHWESCFTHQFSYTTSGPLRHTIRARYRHWLRHKLSTFGEQYGGTACVGCGRCITWCPVGIDLTQEVAAMREEYHPHAAEAGSARAKGVMS